VSRNIVTIGKEVLNFLDWKEPYRSFYVRRGNGDLCVIELVGMLPPKAKRSGVSDVVYDLIKISRDFVENVYATGRFRCEFGDGTVTTLREYKFLPLSLSERSQLQNVLQESAYSRKSGPAVKKQSKPISDQLRAQRSRASKRKAQVQDPKDILKIKKAFLARKVSDTISDRAAAKLVVDMLKDDANPLQLNGGPYFNIGIDAVKRIAGVK
jgi:hypothetical protein